MFAISRAVSLVKIYFPQVAELKLELKKRNLTVSGTKTTLLERYLHQAILRNSKLITLKREMGS